MIDVCVIVAQDKFPASKGQDRMQQEVQWN